jgi:hypothetical protein
MESVDKLVVKPFDIAVYLGVYGGCAFRSEVVARKRRKVQVPPELLSESIIVGFPRYFPRRAMQLRGMSPNRLL